MNRVIQAHEPLFPGYLFCRFDPNRRLEVLQTSTVIDVLRVGRVPAPLCEEEVEALLQAESANLHREPCSYFRAGEPVSIVGGPLRGVSGRVADICDKTKLILDVSLLQRSVSVEIIPEWVWAASDVA